MMHDDTSVLATVTIRGEAEAFNAWAQRMRPQVEQARGARTDENYAAFDFLARDLIFENLPGRNRAPGLRARVVPALRLPVKALGADRH